jgi:hypothetical protein
VADRRFNAKLILPDGTEKPSLIVYFPPTLTGEEVEDIGRQILAVFSGTLYSDVEDEDGRGTTTEDMLDAGLLDSAGVLSADDNKGGGVAHVIGRELLRELADALAARCGTNAEEWPLIEQARRLLDGVKVDAPRKPTAAEVAEWAERHDLRGSATDLRCAFEDAQTLHMADGVAGRDPQTIPPSTPDGADR